jgi:UDP-N-acetylmuramoyl-tripeptide--D-alanyl-D-alanine ligase
VKSAIPENRAAFSLEEIARVTGGTLSGKGETHVQGVASDSRSPLAGKLFVALTGERFDGHAFASAALRSGATALLVERDLGDVGVPAVRVGSTLTALGALARHHRRRSGVKLVAVAGSAGKTTTRSAVALALDAVAPGKVHFASGNLNNAIGVPMVLLGIDADQHRFAVAEIGTNQLGEVEALARMAEPDAAVLTVIGLEHTEGLGDLDRIEREEGSVFSALGASGTAIGNGDDPRVLRQLERVSAQRVRYGFAAGLEYRIVERAVGELGPSRVRLARPGRDELAVRWPLLGRPGAYALAAGVAAAEAVADAPLGARAIEAACERITLGEPGRLVPVALANGAVVLDDTYNANPASLESSVATAAEIARARGGRLLLVLGEMRELGDDSPRLHREAGATLVDFGADEVVAVSGDARWLLEPFERAGVRCTFAPDSAAAAARLTGQIAARDVVLVKASRGVRAETIVSALIEAYGRAR